jgi:hypothetical protein
MTPRPDPPCLRGRGRPAVPAGPFPKLDLDLTAYLHEAGAGDSETVTDEL